MTVHRRIALVALLAVTVLAACGGDDDDAATTDAGDGGAAEVQAAAADFAFDPAVVNVAVGGTVTWTNGDAVTHTVTAGVPGEPSGEFEELTLDAGGSASLTFPDAGSFDFFCSIHTAMTVTVEVG